jgi:hypothetical protein
MLFKIQELKPLADYLQQNFDLDPVDWAVGKYFEYGRFIFTLYAINSLSKASTRETSVQT